MKYESKNGFVALVGAGPGDVGLLTLRGKELIEIADVIVYDRLVSDDILALIPKTTQKINVGKSSCNHPVPQDRINEILLEQASLGKFVVRLKGGDPFVFGRGGEELALLVENNIPFEVVSGITSSIAVGAYAGIPVTHRDYCSNFQVVTGHQKGDKHTIDYQNISNSNGTIIFLMGVSALESITSGLINVGMNPQTPSAIIENGTRPNQRKLIAPLCELYKKATEKKFVSPSIIIVGKVCSLSNDFDWFSKKELFGKKIITTRTSELTKKLRCYGAEVYDLPCVDFEPITYNNYFKSIFDEINEYTWLVFTSKNGVDVFFQLLKEYGKDVRILGNCKIATVGSGTTKQLKNYGINCDLTPTSYNGDSLGAELVKIAQPSDKILLFRAENGSTEILRQLINAKIFYKDVAIYRTKIITENAEKIQQLVNDSEKIIVTFTSASTVEGFMKNIGNISLSNITAVCIGEHTAKKANEFGLYTIISKQATVESMLHKILEDFSNVD